MTSHTVNIAQGPDSTFEKIRFWLINLLAFSITMELSAAFIVIPALSIVMIIVADRFDWRVTVSRISSMGYFLTLIFVVHAFWFLPHIIDTGSTKYVERTLPYFLFPLMISSTSLSGDKRTKVFRFFVGSVALSYLLSIFAATYHYFYSIPRWGRPSDFFFHEQFTLGLFNIHPTYYSMLGCAATLFAFISLKGVWRVLAVSFLTLVILLINARITLIIQLLLVFAFLLKSFASGFSVKRLAFLIVSVVVLVFVMRAFSSIYDYPHRKILVNMEGAWERSFAPDIYEGDGGIVIRMALWRSAFAVIREHPILGIGLGYEEKFLVDEYKRNGIVYPAEMALNAHSQPLSYLIGFGVLGFAMLGAVYFRILKEAYLRKCWVYFVFLALFLSIGITESIFNRLLGISLFAFCNSLIVLKLVGNDK